jgi:hypothetical protein
MKKLQRKRRPTNQVVAVEIKKPNKKSDGEQVWAAIPCFNDGENVETATQVWQSLFSSYKKKPRDGKLARELMENTFVLRRRQIICGVTVPVEEVVAKYPPLSQLSHVSAISRNH